LTVGMDSGRFVDFRDFYVGSGRRVLGKKEKDDGQVFGYRVRGLFGFSETLNMNMITTMMMMMMIMNKKEGI